MPSSGEGLEKLNLVISKSIKTEQDIMRKYVTRAGVFREKAFKNTMKYLLSISNRTDFETVILNIQDPFLKKDVAYCLERIIDALNDSERQFNFKQNLTLLETECNDYPRLNPGDEVLF